MSIRETCSCGATFSVDHSDFRFVQTSDRTGHRNISEEDAVRAWRETHRHEERRAWGVDPGTRATAAKGATNTAGDVHGARILLVADLPHHDLAIMWRTALSGAYDVIVLNRPPETLDEQTWVDSELRARLNPGGYLVTPAGRIYAQAQLLIARTARPGRSELHQHEWIETTSISSPTTHLECTGCGQTRTVPRTTEVTGQ